MSKSFVEKNAPKHMNKGRFGAENRARASKFYENTFRLFSSKDYGTGFEKQKRALNEQLFEPLEGDKSKQMEFLDCVVGKDNTTPRLSFAEALGLRQRGWTKDALLMRVRDADYARERYLTAEKSFGRAYELAVKEPRLTVEDFIKFMQADRIACEPTLIQALKTRADLQDMGYVVPEKEKPLMVKRNLGYFDVSSCKFEYRDEIPMFAGYSFDNISLDVLTDNQLDELFKALSEDLKITFKTNQEQKDLVKYSGNQWFLRNFAQKMRKYFTKVNTGVRAPLVNHIILSTSPLKSTTDVAKLVQEVARQIVVEAYDQYESYADANFGRITRLETNERVMTKINADWLAESMCKMGMFSEFDSKVLGKYFNLDAINQMKQLKDKSSEMLSDLAQVHSVCIRRVANAFDIDLDDYAKMSGIELGPYYFEIFDDVICKKSKVTAKNYIRTESVLQNAETSQEKRNVREVVENMLNVKTANQPVKQNLQHEDELEQAVTL